MTKVAAAMKVMWTRRFTMRVYQGWRGPAEVAAPKWSIETIVVCSVTPDSALIGGIERKGL
jgi:hypothetical protein